MLKGKVAVVTGGSRGIGKAICEAFEREGATVVNLSRSSSYACDVADYSQVQQVFAQIIKDYGTIDILVNSAGITKDKLMLSMKPEEFDAVIKTNLYGTFYTMKQVYPIFCKKRSGRIINISSVSGITGNAGQTNYAASKAGVIALTQSAAKELAPRGITCNAIAPGFIETDMTVDFQQNDEVKNKIPMRRFGQAGEIAELAVFLASDKASYITGAVLKADGGLI
ncbi:MAG: beta-ketoacyl-ACP reductase [Firmicutes bacterium]|nr:beta-ketoacyl-ACP reductase [Bacillota bacterium]